MLVENRKNQGEIDKHHDAYKIECMSLAIFKQGTVDRNGTRDAFKAL